ncbi:MAG: 4Fe-4S binding protein [Chloroflexi bacterium]|nr:4Fe-4S binding protein [Chloroflexota bacterium]
MKPMTDQITINRETCTLCGLCKEVCPIRIVHVDDGAQHEYHVVG